jgi:hypothetical protein
MEKQVCQRMDEVFGIPNEEIIETKEVLQEEIIEYVPSDSTSIEIQSKEIKHKWVLPALKTVTSVLFMTFAVKFLLKKIKR